MEVLATLTSDVGRILSKMHLVQPKGNINLITGVRIAHVSIDNNNDGRRTGRWAAGVELIILSLL